VGRIPYATRPTVEDCRQLSIFRLNKMGAFQSYYWSRTLRWSRCGRTLTEVSITTHLDPNVEVEYAQVDHNPPEVISLTEPDRGYKVRLEKTPCNYGGYRWWFLCPSWHYTQVCGKRVGVLYSVDNYFRCRECQNLTYESCRESHKFDGMFRSLGMSPKEGKAHFKEIWPKS